MRDKLFQARGSGCGWTVFGGSHGRGVYKSQGEGGERASGRREQRPATKCGGHV